jgi:hypothetical protein
LIDANLVIGQNIGELLAKLRRAGCEVKTGKHIAVKLPGGGKFIRFDSCGDGYTQEHILERLRGVRDIQKRGASDAGTKRRTEQEINSDAERKAAAYAESTGKRNAPNLLIDIQAKLCEGKGAAYEQWAKIFNLKQMAKTLTWLKENNIDSYEDLKARASAASGEFCMTNQRLRGIESRLKAISELQKQIGTYTKTRNTYAAYVRAGKAPAFYEANRADIVLCQTAKRCFNEQGFKGKLPSINSLKQEWATLDAERKKLYSGYKALKENYTALTVALGNTERILGIAPDGQIREPERMVTANKLRDHEIR